MRELTSEYHFVLDRKIPITLPEKVSSMRFLEEFQERKEEDIRKQIGDLLALGVPYNLKDAYATDISDFVEVYVPNNLAERKELFEKVVKESGFYDLHKPEGKVFIIQRTFDFLPQIQRFIVDFKGMRTLLDRSTYRFVEANRKMIAQMFFPEQKLQTVREKITFTHNSYSPSRGELVIRDATKLHSEIRIDNEIYPLYAVESGESDTHQCFDFVELTKMMQRQCLS